MNLNTLKCLIILLLVLNIFKPIILISQENRPIVHNSFILANIPSQNIQNYCKFKKSNIFLKQKGFADEIIISLKLGYQFKNNETEFHGTPDGILLNVALESSMNNSIFIGAGIDLWSGVIDNFKLSETISTRREYSYSEFILYFKNRFRLKLVTFAIGIGVGSHNSTVTSTYGEEKFHSFTIAPILCFEYLFSRNFGLSMETNYKIINSSGIANSVFSIRLGPILLLN